MVFWLASGQPKQVFNPVNPVDPVEWFHVVDLREALTV